MKAILSGVIAAILAAPLLVGAGMAYSNNYQISWQYVIVIISALDVLVAYIVAGMVSKRGERGGGR